MFSKSRKRAVGVLAVSMAVAVSALGGVAQASAPAPLPYCSASSVKVDLKVLLSTLSLNPFQVGEGRTCSNQFQRIVGIAAGAVNAQSLVTDTSVLGYAHSLIGHANVIVPGLVVDANALETSAAPLCGDGPQGFVTSSQVAKLTVNGYQITVPAHNISTVTYLPLGIVVYLNRVQSTRSSTVVDAVSIVTPLANVNIAESKLTGNPCSFGPESPPLD